MSDRTQAEGRDMYTEHDFPFKERAGEDIINQNIRWLRELDRYIKYGPYKSDDDIPVPVIVINPHDPFTGTSGSNVNWSVSGVIQNYSSDITYTAITIDAGARGKTTTPVNGGSFSYTAVGDFIKSITADIDLVLTVSASKGGTTKNSAPTNGTIKFTLTPATPATPTITFDTGSTSTVVGIVTDPKESTDSPKFNGVVTIPPNSTITSLSYAINGGTKTPLTQKDVDDTHKSFTVDVAPSSFKEGDNVFTVYAQVTDKTSGAISKVGEKNTTISGVKVIDITTDLPEYVLTDGGTDVTVTGTVVTDPNTAQTLSGVSVVVNSNASIPAVNGRSGESFTVKLPISQFVNGDNTIMFTVNGTCSAGKIPTAIYKATTTGISSVKSPTITITANPTEVNLDHDPKDNIIFSGDVTIPDDATIKSITIQVGTTTPAPVTNINGTKYTLAMDSTRFKVFDNAVVATVITTKDGFDSAPGTASMNVKGTLNPATKPILVLNKPAPMNGEYDGTINWVVTGSLSNRQDGNTYSSVTISADSRGHDTTELKADDTFSYTATGAMAENIIGDFNVSATIDTTRGYDTETSDPATTDITFNIQAEGATVSLDNNTGVYSIVPAGNTINKETGITITGKITLPDGFGIDTAVLESDYQSALSIVDDIDADNKFTVKLDPDYFKNAAPADVKPLTISVVGIKDGVETNKASAVYTVSVLSLPIYSLTPSTNPFDITPGVTTFISARLDNRSMNGIQFNGGTLTINGVESSAKPDVTNHGTMGWVTTGDNFVIGENTIRADVTGIWNDSVSGVSSFETKITAIEKPATPTISDLKSDMSYVDINEKPPVDVTITGNVVITDDSDIDTVTLSVGSGTAIEPDSITGNAFVFKVKSDKFALNDNSCIVSATTKKGGNISDTGTAKCSVYGVYGPPDKPILEFDVPTPITTYVGYAQNWEMTGKLTNPQPGVSYSQITIDAGARGSDKFNLNADGKTFKYDAVGVPSGFVANITGDIDVTATIDASRAGETVTSDPAKGTVLFTVTGIAPDITINTDASVLGKCIDFAGDTGNKQKPAEIVITGNIGVYEHSKLNSFTAGFKYPYTDDVDSSLYKPDGTFSIPLPADSPELSKEALVAGVAYTLNATVLSDIDNKVSKVGANVVKIPIRYFARYTFSGDTTIDVTTGGSNTATINVTYVPNTTRTTESFHDIYALVGEDKEKIQGVLSTDKLSATITIPQSKCVEGDNTVHVYATADYSYNGTLVTPQYAIRDTTLKGVTK